MAENRRLSLPLAASLVCSLALCSPLAAAPMSVDPPTGSATAATAAVVRGAGFEPASRVSLLGGGPWRTGEFVLDGNSLANGVALSGDRALLAFFEAAPFKSGGLRVIDVTDRTAPREIGAYVLPDITGMDVAVDGHRAILLSYNIYTLDGALHEVDLTDPTAPRETAIHYFDRQPRRMHLAPGHVAVTIVGSSPGVWLFDRADLARAPLEFPVPGEPWDAEIADGRLFVTWGDGVSASGLSVFDLADPAAAPRELPLPGSAYGIAAGLGLIAVSTGDPQGASVLVAVDPATLAVLGEVPTAGVATAVRIAGDRAYLAEGGAGVEVVSLRDPAAPRVLGRFAGLSLSAWDLAVGDHAAFVADHPSGLDVIDLSRPSAPAPLAVAATGGFARRVAVDGALAAMANGDAGVAFVDLADPARPVVRGTLPVDGGANGVALRGAQAFVAAGVAGLSVVDAGALDVLGSADTPGTAFDVALSGERAYVADGSRGLAIVDVADPARPVVIAQRDTLGSAVDVALRGTTALVADGRRGLVTIDVSDPLRPRTLAELRSCAGELIVFASGVAVDGAGRAFVAAGTQGVFVVDVTDAARPACLGKLSTEARAEGVALDETGRVLVADAEAGLLSIDAADLSAPVTIGRYSFPSPALGLAPAGGLVLVAAGASGLAVVRPNPPVSDVRVVDEATIAALIPSGLASGPYDVRVTTPGAPSVDLRNGFAVCSALALAARLEPVAGTTTMTVPPSWRVFVDTPDELGPAQVHLRMPAGVEDAVWSWSTLPGADETTFELMVSREVAAVRARGADESAARAIWAAACGGGLAVAQRDPAGRSFGDVHLSVGRPPRRAERYAYTVANGVVVAAAAEAPAADFVFDVSAGDDAGCTTATEASFTNSLVDLCRDAMENGWLCSRPAPPQPNQIGLHGETRTKNASGRRDGP